MGRSILDAVRGKQAQPEAEQPAAQPEVQHTQQCLEAQAKYDAWAKENPYACEHCHGQGILGYVHDRDTGSGDYITCKHCFDEGICPVCGIPLGKIFTCPTCHTEMDENGYCPICGEYIDASNYEHCEACGWDFDDASTHSPYVECCCYENQLDSPYAAHSMGIFAEYGEGEDDTVEFYAELPDNWGEGDYPYTASDIAFDAAREDRIFGK